MEKLVTRDIHAKNGDFQINIDEISILKNKVNIIFGENGAGKTTLLNAIFEDGNIFYGYKKTLLTQNSFTFNKSCSKNIEMVLKWNKSKKMASEYLDIVGLLDKQNCVGNELSGGEKKRLAFAMALATEADIILLDEPFANLDVNSQNKIKETIKNLKGIKTIIVVTHLADISEEIGDFFIEIKNGNLVKSYSY